MATLQTILLLIFFMSFLVIKCFLFVGIFDKGNLLFKVFFFGNKIENMEKNVFLTT